MGSDAAAFVANLFTRGLEFIQRVPQVKRSLLQTMQSEAWPRKRPAHNVGKGAMSARWLVGFVEPCSDGFLLGRSLRPRSAAPFLGWLLRRNFCRFRSFRKPLLYTPSP